MTFETVDTLSDAKFWLAVGAMLVALIGIVTYLLREPDDTPVKPPKGDDQWKGWR